MTKAPKAWSIVRPGLYIARGALPADRVGAILSARQRLRLGPHRLAPEVGCPRSTIYAVLRRHCLSRLDHLDRPSSVPVRYVRERPGELLHLDVKKLGRIPDGGGHQKLGREDGMRQRRRGGRAMGYDFVHVAVDDTSRVAYVAVLSDQRGPTTARFLLDAAAFFAARGVRIEQLLTDRALNYTRSRDFAQAADALGIQRLVTKPYRPQTNGKAERFIRTLIEEWAYARLYHSNRERLDALPAYMRFYNQRRPHTALGGRHPMAVLVNNVRGNYT